MKLVSITMLYSILLILFIHSSGYYFIIPEIPHKFLCILGILLIILGIPFLIISIITLNKSYKADLLNVKGVYSVCRHPLYSSWIIFIVPGVICLLDSWLLFTIPVVLYLTFKILIKQEEAYLLEKFGNQFIDYKDKVGLLVPMFCKYDNKKEEM